MAVVLSTSCWKTLFWSQYSYLGLDPRGLSDKYVKSYWDLNRNHVLIDYKYCLENPLNYKGYSEKYWGLTASYSRNKDGSVGYAAHQPMKEDFGVITPTAALSSNALHTKRIDGCFKIFV